MGPVFRGAAIGAPAGYCIGRGIADVATGSPVGLLPFALGLLAIAALMASLSAGGNP